MDIGIPKEIKPHEYRVSVTPTGVEQLIRHGHRVRVEAGAGIGSGFPDEEYRRTGSEIYEDADDLWRESELIVKVKEPVAEEYPRMQPFHTLFAYLHLAADKKFFEAARETGLTAIAYETVRDKRGTLPLLIPMSEIAGRLSVQEGARFLEKPSGGRGILLGGVPGVAPANVMILGAGVVGANAAVIAAGMGADVLLYDINLQRLRSLEETLPPRVRTRYSSTAAIQEELSDVDLVIGAILQPGAPAERIITQEMLSAMKKGAVLVDVAIDQGGCFETSRPTTHDNPVFHVDGVLHYCVTNMPGSVPVTSTLGLTHATLPYIHQIAANGWKEACRESPELLSGLNLSDGVVLNRAVAETFGVEYCPPDQFLKDF